MNIEKVERKDYLNATFGFFNVSSVAGAHAGLWLYVIIGKSLLPSMIYFPLFAALALALLKYLSEWVHEAAHFNFLPSRKWNDRLINLFAGSVFLNPIQAHRTGHLQHHRNSYFFEGNDADTALLTIESRSDIRNGLIRDLLGITALQMLFPANKPAEKQASKRTFLLGALALHALVFVICLLLHRIAEWFIFYWVLGTIYPLMNRLRVYGQHGKLIEQGKASFAQSDISRTIESGFFDRFFFISELMLYHHEHHHSPHLPYRALSRICKRNKEDPNTFSTSLWKTLSRLYVGLPE